MRQIRAGGIALPILAGESLDGDYWIEAVPDLSDFYNLTYDSIYGDDPDPRVNDFVTRFTAMHGARPVTGHALRSIDAQDAPDGCRQTLARDEETQNA